MAPTDDESRVDALRKIISSLDRQITAELDCGEAEPASLGAVCGGVVGGMFLGILIAGAEGGSVGAVLGGAAAKQVSGWGHSSIDSERVDSLMEQKGDAELMLSRLNAATDYQYANSEERFANSLAVRVARYGCATVLVLIILACVVGTIMTL